MSVQVISSSTYALFAAAKSLTVFYVVALVCSMAQALINLVPFSLIMNNWFNEKRGMAIGFVCAGSGLGGMLFNLIGGRLVESIGWRSTVLVFTGIMCLVYKVIIKFIILNNIIISSNSKCCMRRT